MYYWDSMTSKPKPVRRKARDRDRAGLEIFECTSFVSNGVDVLVYTDESGGNPIRIRRARLRALGITVMAALEGLHETR